MDAQETKIYTAILISGVVIGIIIVYFIISIIRQQRRNLDLHKKNILAEITGLENDRARIASDLHDEFGPTLAAVKLKINSFELSDEEDKRQLEKTSAHIDTMLKRVREISYDMMPNTLKRKGLLVALKEFIDFIGNTSKLDIQLHVSGDMKFDEKNSIHIYRIMQEIIHNTIKHSGATTLIIEFILEKNKISIITKDNGSGFDKMERQHASSGLGLRNLLSRTQLLGGEMFLETKKGMGTEYTFEIPV